MKSIINFFFLLIFSTNSNFFLGKKYNFKIDCISLVTEFFKNNIKFQKYTILIFLKHLFFSIFSFVYYPVAIGIYFTNVRFIIVDTFTVGEFIVQTNIFIKKNKKIKKKLVLLSPNAICSNKTVNDMFCNEVFIIKNNLICLILSPLTYIYFISLRVIELKKGLLPLHTFSKGYIDIYDEYLFCEHKYSKVSYDLNKKFFSFNNFSNKLGIKLKRKICVLNIRSDKNSDLRNANINKFDKSINFLISKGYFVINISNKKLRARKNLINLIDYENYKELQIYSIFNSSIYLGQSSGLTSLASLLNKRIIVTDVILYKESWINKNYISIFKKIYFKNKILDLKKIFEYDISFSLWRSNSINKNLTLRDNTSSEIFNMTKSFLFKKNKNNNLKFLKKFKLNKIVYDNLVLRKCDNKFFNENLR